MNLFDRCRYRLRQRFSRKPGCDATRGSEAAPCNSAGEVLYASPPALALRWLKAQELATGGMRLHSGSLKASPGVTGGLVSTLMHYGEGKLAERLASWLQRVQSADGAYLSEDGIPSLFETGHALRGLVVFSERAPEVLGAVERAAGYLLHRINRHRWKGCDSGSEESGSPAMWLCLLPALRQASIALERPDLQAAVARRADELSRLVGVAPDGPTHDLAETLEAWIDLGRPQHAAPVLDRLQRRQDRKGAVSAWAGCAWISISGLAHLAVCWYKTGRREPAEGVMNWLDAHQLASGGFAGSCGRQAAYFKGIELAWAVKRYLDAHRLRLKAAFNGPLMDMLPAEISAADGRAQAVLEVVQPGHRVAEIGCGHGRFLKMLRHCVPDIRCTGVDISTAMLQQLPADMETREGSMESIPLPDEKFDLVFSVEAIEHATNPEAAVAEMIRITRPGGWVLILDKQQAHWGRKVCPPWERWPSFEGMQRLLRRGCDGVCARPIAYNNVPASDGLMVAWQGRKRARPVAIEEECRINCC